MGSGQYDDVRLPPEVSAAMKPIKVLHVTNVEKENYYLVNLADHTDPSDVEFSFVTFGSADCEFVQDFQRRGLKAVGLDSLGRGAYPQAYRGIKSILATAAPDIVHAHLFDPALVALFAARRAGIYTVLTRHHSDAIHVITSSVKRRFYLAVDSYISRLADHIIAPSRMVREFLVEREGVADNKVTVLPYGQTTGRFDAVTPEKISSLRSELSMDGRLSLVCVSRLNHRKGHKFLFAAMAELIREGLDAQVILVGDGDEKAALETLAASLGIHDRVVFLGWRDDALAVLAAGDIVVHPSLEDALSSAVIEAIMLEKPIVATDISGVRDSLDDGRYGVIVAPESSVSIVAGIRDVLKDIGAARKRAAAGRKFLLEYMSSQRVADETLCIYKRVLGQL
ncbi:MAG: glycosyltransferase [Pyrinomonadaceae bacterium]